MATQWRELAAVGDPARRVERERWAAALDQMAERKIDPTEPVMSSEAEEKKP
jgi:hypothetical protein